MCSGDYPDEFPCVCYALREDREIELGECTLKQAHRHKRYGLGIIYLKLGQEECSRKKVPVKDRSWLAG